jgi:hypothetical protein
LDFHQLTIKKSLSMGNAIVDGNVEFMGTTLGQVDANNITVAGTLRIIPNQIHSINWIDGGEFLIPNSTVGKLQIPAAEAVWPKQTDLRNLIYKEFDFLEADGPDNVIAVTPESVKLYKHWLALSLRSKQPPSPQPYIELADELKARGYEDAATQLRIEERERARSHSVGLAWVWETIKYLLIGHGYDLRGAWIAAGFLLVMGRLALLRSPKARAAGFGFAYSFDLLTPIVELRKKHFEIELEPAVRVYFYIHRALGFVLATFLVAGITGLAKIG